MMVYPGLKLGYAQVQGQRHTFFLRAVQNQESSCQSVSMAKLFFGGGGLLCDKLQNLWFDVTDIMMCNMYV